MKNIYIVCIIIVVLIIVLYIYNSSTKKEGYGTVMGSVAPYQDSTTRCYDTCDREDPNDRLLPQANILCGMKCDGNATILNENNIPPNEVKHNDVSSVPINLDKCQNMCSGSGTDNEREKCISVCYGNMEVAEWCDTLWCPYSTLPHEECMGLCIATNSVKNSQVAWTWGKR